MKRLGRCWLGVLVLLALCLGSAPRARAEGSEADIATARELAKEGQKALDKKDYATAVDHFRRAEELYHAPTLLVALARSYVGLGKYVSARESYNKVLRLQLPKDAPGPFVQAVKEAKAEIGPLEDKVAWVTITVSGTDKPEVKLDDEAVPVAALGAKRAVDPGDHTVVATAEGFSTDEKKFSVQSKAETSVGLTLAALPKPVAGPGTAGGKPAGGADSAGGSNTVQLVGFVAIGVGAAGLIVGGITGGLAMGKHSTLNDNCVDGNCPSSQQSTLDSYHTLGLVSTIGFIAGGVLAATGIVLVLVAPSGEAEASAPAATVSAGLGSIQATVRF